MKSIGRRISGSRGSSSGDDGGGSGGSKGKDRDVDGRDRDGPDDHQVDPDAVTVKNDAVSLPPSLRQSFNNNNVTTSPSASFSLTSSQFGMMMGIQKSSSIQLLSSSMRRKMNQHDDDPGGIYDGNNSLMDRSGQLQQQQQPPKRTSRSDVHPQHQQDDHEFTIDKLQFASLRPALYGRDDEVTQLQRIFETIMHRTPLSPSPPDEEDDGETSGPSHTKGTSTTHRPTPPPRQFVLIGGSAGVGKSVLPSEALQASGLVRRHGGFYLSGKSDTTSSSSPLGVTSTTSVDLIITTTDEEYQQQYHLDRTTKPYAAIGDACKQLCEDLILHLGNKDGDSSGNSGIFSRRTSDQMTVASERNAPSTDGECDDNDDSHSKHRTTGGNFNRWNFTLADFVSKIHDAMDNESIHLLTASLIPELHEVILMAGRAKDKSKNLGVTNGECLEADPEDDGSYPTTTSLQDGHYLEVKQAFQNAFRRFIRVVSSFGPVVLVLDDLQWSDKPSLDLMESLLIDDTIPSLMIVGTYRNDEVDIQNDNIANAQEAHRLSQAVQNIKNMHSDCPLFSMTEIEIGNLSELDIQCMLENLLSSSPVQSKELAECVHHKTLGNAFYVKQYLLSLYDRDLLSFNFGSLTWKWDVERIKARGMPTENVVDLLTTKLKRLSPIIQQVLPQIACLGSRFTARSFWIIVNHYCDQDALSQAVTEYRLAKVGEYQSSTSPSVKGAGDQKTGTTPSETMPLVYSVLDLMEDEGLIVSTRGFKIWEHDKIQESALSLVDKDQLDVIQFQVGELLWNQYTPEELANELFVVTNLLNSVSDPYPQSDGGAMSKRIEIAKLNLEAGTRSFSSSAFSSAINYFARGINLLPTGDVKWNPKHKDLSLQLHGNYAETCFCVALHEESNRVCDEVLNLGRLTMMEKRRFHNVRLHSLGSHNHTAQAMAHTVNVLSKLGCKFPNRWKSVYAITGVLRLMSKSSKAVARLENLPPVKDEKIEWIFYLLDRLATYAFQHDSDLLPLVVLKSLRYTIRYGASSMAGPIFSFVGLMLAASLGDPQGGKTYADLALKSINRSTKARTHFICYYFILPFTVPSNKCKKPLLEGYEAGMRSGDLESAFWCVCVFLEIQLFTTCKLNEILEDFETYGLQMKAYQQEKILVSTKFMWQAAENLKKGVPDGHILKGDIMDETTYVDQIKGKEEHAHEWHHLMRFKALAAFWSDQHRAVVDIIASEDYHSYSLEKHLPGNYGNVPLYAMLSLSCIAVARECQPKRPRESRRYIAWAKKFYKRIKDWVHKGNCNCQHTEFLLKAELASFRDDLNDAKMNYEVAILLAGRRGLRGDQALAHECRGDFARRNGDVEDSQYHYNLALTLYDEWGAAAKCNRMRSNLGASAYPVDEVEIADTCTIDDSAAMSKLGN